MTKILNLFVFVGFVSLVQSIHTNVNANFDLNADVNGFAPVAGEKNEFIFVNHFSKFYFLIRTFFVEPMDDAANSGLALPNSDSKKWVGRFRVQIDQAFSKKLYFLVFLMKEEFQLIVVIKYR